MEISTSFDQIAAEVEGLREDMVQALVRLLSVPAMAPESGGKGEVRKAEVLVEILGELGFDRLERFDIEDERVASKIRPNVVAYYEGENRAQKLWIITHLDVVPPGEESHWAVTKPFRPIVLDGKVYGRGSEDNGQSLVASIFAVKALKNLGRRPQRTVALAFVADEETKSKYGVQHLIQQGLFGTKDFIVVPDSGTEAGDFIEIAEKSGISFRVRTLGKQTHASKPSRGLNAHRIGMEYALKLDEFLHAKYSEKNEDFDPPESTFEPTKKDQNVDAVNIIPGEDAAYFDCRVLPRYDLEAVLADASAIAREVERRHGAKITLELLSKFAAPKPTNADSQVVLMLREAIRTVRKVDPKTGGIGGGTCAAFLREKGMPAAVWCTVDETAHQPDEYAKVENMVNDAKVFALLAVS